MVLIFLYLLLVVIIFKDPSISNCKFLFNLLASIEPRAIDETIIMEGDSPESLQNNAKYVIAVARKLEA